MPKKILIVAANPLKTQPLRLDQEVREIKEGLRLSKGRDMFEIEQELAVRTKDLRRALLTHKPQIVHFCGHGEIDGILLEDNNGNAALVSREALGNLFELFEEDVECVLLNACLSEPQAEAIGEHIAYVVGMNQKIGDKAAIEFAVGFYDALGAGESYERAFKFGRIAIELEGLDEEDTPQLFKNPNASEKQQQDVSTPSGTGAGVDPENQEAYNLVVEKIRLLKNQYATETRKEEKLRLKALIKEAEEDLEMLT